MWNSENGVPVQGLCSAISIFLDTRFHISQYEIKVIQCSGVPVIYGQKWGVPSALGICAFCYMWNLFSVVVLHGSMVNWGGSLCLGYMCILQYVKLIWCSGVAEIYGQLGGPSALGICAFFDVWNLFGVVVLHGSMVNWRGIHLPWVYVHSSISETDWV